MLLTPALSGCQESVHRQHLSCARPTCRGLSQVARLGQTAFRLAKSPVLVTHQAEHGQQLRLGALMFAETATVGRQNPLRDFARHPSKRHQADFGHLPLLPHQKTPSPLSRPHSYSLSVTSMSTEPLNVLCFDTVLQVLILKEMQERGKLRRVPQEWGRKFRMELDYTRQTSTNTILCQ